MVSDPGISRTNIDLRTALRARHKIYHMNMIYSLGFWDKSIQKCHSGEMKNPEK